MDKSKDQQQPDPATARPPAGGAASNPSKQSVPLVGVGNAGEDVKAIQRAPGVKKVDGKFGPKTEAAVSAYQRKIDFQADGIVGPATKAALLRDYPEIASQPSKVATAGSQKGVVPGQRPLAAGAEVGPNHPSQNRSAPSTPQAGRRVGVGDAGQQVAEIQRALGMQGNDVDGKFGQRTRDAVVAFQKSHRNLEVDGVVGTNTMNALHATNRQTQPQNSPLDRLGRITKAVEDGVKGWYNATFGPKPEVLAQGKAQNGQGMPSRQQGTAALNIPSR